MPPHGVYATTVRLDGVIYPAVTNIGVRPTFGDSTRTMIETHVLDVDRDLYGQTLRLASSSGCATSGASMARRAEAQIAADVRESARRLFERMSL